MKEGGESKLQRDESLMKEEGDDLLVDGGMEGKEGWREGRKDDARTCDGQMDDLADIAHDQVLPHAKPVNKNTNKTIVGWLSSFIPSSALLPFLLTLPPSLPPSLPSLHTCPHSTAW